MRFLAAVAVVLLLTACHNGSAGAGTPIPTPTVPPGPLLYVADSGNNSIFVFQRTASGVALPLHTVFGAATLLNAPFPIATDPAANIWVANHASPPTLLEYPPGAVGNFAPITIMFVSSPIIPGNLDVRGLVFDAAGKLYVATGPTNHVMVYAGGAKDTPVPLQDITGFSTQINDAEGIALDRSGNIYTTSLGSDAILEFAAGASGNVAPIRIIKGFFNTHLSKPSYVAVDAAGDIFALNSTNGIITEYAPGASGDTAPIAMFSRPQMAGQISFDAAGNLYVGASAINPGAVAVYAPPFTSTSLPAQLLFSPVFSKPTGVFAP